jgi:hypothetical protein
MRDRPARRNPRARECARASVCPPAVVKDATAALRHPKLGDGYPGALVNFGFLASAVWSKEEALAAMK